MKKINKLALLVCLTLAAAIFTAAPVSAASKTNLVKEYTYKQYILKNGAWVSAENTGVKYHKDIIKYNKKKDPVKITTKEYLKSGKKRSSVAKIKYTYKKGKKTKRKIYRTTTTYKKGVPASSSVNSGDGYGRSFQYKFKSRYATYVLYRDIDPNDVDGDIEPISMIFNVTTKNGLPAKITGNAPGGFPVVMTFYTSGSKKGLVKTVFYDDSSELAGGEVEVDKRVFSYSYKVKKGQVVKAVRKCTSTFGYTTLNGKTYSDAGLEKTYYKTEITFKYNKTKAKKSRYCAMINDIVANLNEDDAYGRPVLYTWWY